MTGLIVIDESGDLGSGGSEYFSMAAIVTMRARNLKPIAKLLPKGKQECKWGNSGSGKRDEILQAMVDCQFKIVYSVINKNNPSSRNYLYGNDLYEMMLRHVVSDAMSISPCRDVRVHVDRSRFISLERLKEIVDEEADRNGIHVVDCAKHTSDHNPCIQIVDFVAGASRALYEDGNRSIEVLVGKVSVARRL